ARPLPAVAERADGHEGLLRSARRDGHQLDPEPPALRARGPGRRGRRHPGRRLRHIFEGGREMIRSTAVLGAGTMGAQIAAHLAIAGVPVLLLDVTPEAAKAGLERAKKIKPDPFFLPDTAALIRTAGFDEGLPEAGGADWIIEAVVETLDVKTALFA